MTLEIVTSLPLRKQKVERLFPGDYFDGTTLWNREGETVRVKCLNPDAIDVHVLPTLSQLDRLGSNDYLDPSKLVHRIEGEGINHANITRRDGITTRRIVWRVS